MAKWNGGGKWNDGVTKWSARPFEYPRPFHVRIEIRTAGGTDYTVDIPDTSQRIENIAEQEIGRYYCQINDGSQLDIDDHDEIVVAGPDQIRMFGGFIFDFEERSTGPHFDYEITAVDYTWLLDHSQGYAEGGGNPSYVNRIYEDASDSAIIQDVMSDFCPEINTTDVDPTTGLPYVRTVEASLDREIYENLTPRQVLDQLCKRTGATWYLDYYKRLHYFSPGSENAPFQLSDNPSQWNYVTYIPYGDLRKTHEHGDCTKVIVKGRPHLTPNTYRYPECNGTDARIELPYKIVPIEGEVKPLIWVDSGAGWVAQKVGYGGTQFTLWDGAGDLEPYQCHVLWYSDDKYLEFYSAPPVGRFVKIYCREWVETYGMAQDLDGYAKYGRHIIKVVEDESIDDDGTAELMAAELLDRWKASRITYTCTVWEHGFRAGQRVYLTNALRGLSADDYIIRRVSTRNIGTEYWQYDLEMGKYYPTTVDTVRDIVEKRLGKKDKWQEEGWIVEAEDGSDPTITWRIVETGGTADDKWTMGVDDSDAELLKIHPGSALVDDSLLELSSTGVLEIKHAGGGVVRLQDYNSVNLSLLGQHDFIGRDSGDNEDYGADIRVTQDGAAGARVPCYMDLVTADENTVHQSIPPLRVQKTGRISMNTVVASGQLHVDQRDATAAIPVLVLDQADVDQPFIKFIDEAAAGDLTRGLVSESDVNTATRTGWAKVEIEDGGGQIANGSYHVPFYELA